MAESAAGFLKPVYAGVHEKSHHVRQTYRSARLRRLWNGVRLASGGVSLALFLVALFAVIAVALSIPMVFAMHGGALAGTPLLPAWLQAL